MIDILYYYMEALTGITLGGVWSMYWSGSMADKERLILPYANLCCYVIIATIAVGLLSIGVNMSMLVE